MRVFAGEFYGYWYVQALRAELGVIRCGLESESLTAAILQLPHSTADRPRHVHCRARAFSLACPKPGSSLKRRTSTTKPATRRTRPTIPSSACSSTSPKSLPFSAPQSLRWPSPI